MKILLTNDDGISSKGLYSLAQKLSKTNEVYVFAPSSQKSACSQSLTVHSSFSFDEIKWDNIKQAVSVDGSPADCVKLALKFFSIKPDVVLSGPNEGSNLGTDILYSGTVAGAMEGALNDYPSIAVSQCGRNRSPEHLIEFINQNLVKIMDFQKMPYGVININYPDCDAEEIQGIKITKMGNTKYTDYYVESIINGKSAYRLAGDIIEHEDEAEECDTKLSQRKFITITPLKIDRTDYNAFDGLKALQYNF